MPQRIHQSRVGHRPGFLFIPEKIRTFVPTNTNPESQMTRPQAPNKTILAYPGGYELPSIMTLKAICACVIVHIHSAGDYMLSILPAYRIVIPIFFMISGYFIPDGTGRINPDKLKRAMAKMVKIILCTNIPYALYWLLYAIRNDNFSIFTSASGWLRFVVLGDTFCHALWYLMSYLQVLLIVWGLVKIKSIRVLYWLIPIGIISGLCLGTYAPLLFDASFGYELNRNTFTIGLPCVALGILIRRRQHRLTFSTARLLVAVVTLTALAFLECSGPVKDYMVEYGDTFIATTPLAVAVFLLFLNCPRLGKCNTLTAIGRRDSLYIYLIHVMIIWCLSNIRPFPFGFPDAMIVYLIALALSEIYLFIKSKTRLGFLP